jgi:hypothetical protein
VIGSAIPYVIGGGLFLGLVFGEEWLQRQTGQSWWAIHQLGWGVFSVGLAVLIASAGHPLGALLALGLAVFEFALARRSWVELGSRDVLERHRLEIESREAVTPRPTGVGVRGAVFILAVVGLWTLLEHWGLSWVSAGLVSSMVAVVVLRLWRRRSLVMSSGERSEPPMMSVDRSVVAPTSFGDDHAARDRIAEGGFQFSLSGRSARLVGWLVERLTGSSDSHDE